MATIACRHPWRSTDCPGDCNALQCQALLLTEKIEVPAPAERMRIMRERRRRRGLRELRLVVPDSRLQSVRRRVAAQVARLVPSSEDDALNWIEAVSEFDEPTAGDETR